MRPFQWRGWRPLGIGLSTAALLGGFACGRDTPPGPGEFRGSPLGAPLSKASFVLPTTEGEPFEFREETDGFVTLLFFGYTHCPDICPVHMANIAAVLEKLAPQVANRVKVVMVTVDPERDTPRRLRGWLDNFNHAFIGLTGTHEQLASVQRLFSLPVAVKQGDGPDYLVGHAAYVIAFSLDNQAHLVYPSGTRQADWAHDLPLLVQEAWQQ